jgi:predicted transcriptional regulator
VVDLFQARRVRRLPVTRDKKLVGLVSRHDLIRFILTTRDRVSGKGKSSGSDLSKGAGVKARKRESQIAASNACST